MDGKTVDLPASRAPWSIWRIRAQQDGLVGLGQMGELGQVMAHPCGVDQRELVARCGPGPGVQTIACRLQGSGHAGRLQN